MLDHGEAKAVIVDPEFAGIMKKALALRQSTAPLLVIDVADAALRPAEPIGSIGYEAFVARGRGLASGSIRATSGTPLP